MKFQSGLKMKMYGFFSYILGNLIPVITQSLCFDFVFGNKSCKILLKPTILTSKYNFKFKLFSKYINNISYFAGLFDKCVHETAMLRTTVKLQYKDLHTELRNALKDSRRGQLVPSSCSTCHYHLHSTLHHFR